MSIRLVPPDVTNRDDVVAKSARYMLIYLVTKARPDAPDEEILAVVDKLIEPFESELGWFLDEFDYCEFEQFTWPQPNRRPRYWERSPESKG